LNWHLNLRFWSFCARAEKMVVRLASAITFALAWKDLSDCNHGKKC
jgi:hypothetical protein